MKGKIFMQELNWNDWYIMIKAIKSDSCPVFPSRKKIILNKIDFLSKTDPEVKQALKELKDCETRIDPKFKLSNGFKL